MDDFRNSILELVGLLCEGRELDLYERHLFALNLLTRSAVAIQVKHTKE